MLEASRAKVGQMKLVYVKMLLRATLLTGVVELAPLMNPRVSKPAPDSLVQSLWSA